MAGTFGGSGVRRLESGAWGIPFTMGLLITLAGVFLLATVVVTSVFSVFFVGVVLVVSGVAEIVHATRRRASGAPWLALLAGLLRIVVGALLLARPVAGLEALTLLLTGFFFVGGLFYLVISVADRYPRWGWDAAFGAASILLGAIVLAQWPASALWLLGTVVSVELVARGAALMGLSWSFRSRLGAPPRSAAPA